MELVKGDLKREMDEKAAIEQKAKQYEILYDHSLDLYLKAVFHLAKMAALNPLDWHIGRFSLDPTVRVLVEKLAEKMKTDLPPPPPPPVMPRGLLGSGREHYEPLTIERLNKGGQPKDSNKDKQ